LALTVFWLAKTKLSRRAFPSFSITFSILDLLFSMLKKAVKNKSKAKRRVSRITYLSLKPVKNFRLFSSANFFLLLIELI
jgi:hypothetical protein